MNQPLLKCEHVDFGYENYDVVKDVSMEINPGDYLCIVGENGSGKSTLMKGLLGLIKPTGGVLTLADELRRSGIGYLPQQTPAQKDFPATVQEVVISGCLGKRGNRPFYSMEERKLAAVNMEKLGITDLKKSCYRDLSGGQKQRTLHPGFLRGDPPSKQGREGGCPHGLPRYRKYRDPGQQDLTVETDGPVLRDRG